MLPISGKYSDYAYQVKAQLEQHDLRGTVDGRDERTGRKIRDAEMGKIPYLLVVGEKEAQDNIISVRKHGEGDLGSMPLEDFVKSVQSQMAVAM